MGKESRRTEKTASQMLKELRRSDPATELAESFRRASRAVEAASRDLVALRHRVKPPPR